MPCDKTWELLKVAVSPRGYFYNLAGKISRWNTRGGRNSSEKRIESVNIFWDG